MKNKYNKSPNKTTEVVYYRAHPDILSAKRKEDREKLTYDWILIVPKYPEWKKNLYWNVWFWSLYAFLFTFVQVTDFSYKTTGLFTSIIFIIIFVVTNYIVASKQVKKYESQYYAEFE